MPDKFLNPFFISMGVIVPKLLEHFKKPFGEVNLVQNFQPFQNSPEGVSAVYISWNGSAPRGTPAQPERWNKDRGVFETPVTQYYETSFQLMASAQASSSDMQAATSADIANLLRVMLLSTKAKMLFKQEGYQVLRASGVRSHKVLNEQKQFEDFPNFDIVFSHYQTIIGEEQPATVTGEFYRANGD